MRVARPRNRLKKETTRLSVSEVKYIHLDKRGIRRFALHRSRFLQIYQKFEFVVCVRTSLR